MTLGEVAEVQSEGWKLPDVAAACQASRSSSAAALEEDSDPELEMTLQALALGNPPRHPVSGRRKFAVLFD